MTTRTKISKGLTSAKWLLPGTVVERYLKCRKAGCGICREQGGHGPVYYLSIRGEDKRTHMIYIPKEHLREVRAGVAAQKRVVQGMRDLARKELEQWRKRRSKKR